MVNLEKILATVGGIPFSAMRNITKSNTKKKKRSKKKTQRGGDRDHLSMMKRRKRKKRKTANRVRTAAALRVPPKGVIIRKGDKLYQSNGKSMIFLSH